MHVRMSPSPAAMCEHSIYNSLLRPSAPRRQPAFTTHRLRKQRRLSPVQAGLSLDSAPLEVLIGGSAAVLTFTGFLAYEAIKAARNQPFGQQPVDAGAPNEAPLPRENAVLVFGAAGKTGRLLVNELVLQGRTVIAAVRDTDRARDAFAELGIAEGRQADPSRGLLFIEGGVDVTNPDTLSQRLFAGARQVAMCLGPIFGRIPEGGMGYLDGMTSERVDAEGVSNIATAAKNFLPRQQKSSVEILPMRSEEDLKRWQRLDDVIMGGNSSSVLSPAEDGSGALWSGDLVLEGGGFCGARTEPMSLDLSSYDGVALRVRGGGRTLKLNIKTADFIEPEDTYQASIETTEGNDYTEVFLPWHEFVPVKRARSVPNGPPLDPRNIRQFGIVYSRFAYNGFPNECYTPGPFQILLEGGIRAVKLPRPQLILLSSAGVERNAKIGDDQEARKMDIPIVQLNPGGVLNHKYAGEAAVRASGLAYCVVRPTGMSDDGGADGPVLLEASQGDRISGKVSRAEVATVLATALSLPSAARKTFELRRQQAADAKGKEMTHGDMLRLFLGIVPDSARPRIGAEPFPAVVPPPPPPTQDRKEEILADPRVKAASARGAGGRVRTSEETAATAATVVAAGDDGRGDAVAAASGSEGSEKKESKEQRGGAPEVGTKKETGENVKQVRDWIRKWRARTLEKALPRDALAASDQQQQEK
jgi:uncharacterized protein YbjT (DUF2867 family)